MRSEPKNHLGKLIRDARELHGWTQEDMKVKLSMSRPISVSKWERGEAPVPVHHWLELMRILEVREEVFLEAAKKDHHRQLSLFLSLTHSLKGSMDELGGFAWEFIFKNLTPGLTREVDRLRRQYPEMTPLEFTRSAIMYFLEKAGLGLDRNNRPIESPGVPHPPRSSKSRR